MRSLRSSLLRDSTAWQRAPNRLPPFGLLVAAACLVLLSGARNLSADAGGWSAAGSMTDARVNHTATLLSDGRVLVVGGTNGSVTLGTADLYDPVTGMWSPAGTMSTPRMDHTAMLLSNGKVLVAGGYDGSSYLASAELYDPATGIWSSTGAMNIPRRNHKIGR